jgi:uncharacterized protein YcbK (DUF882 family)
MSLLTSRTSESKNSSKSQPLVSSQTDEIETSKLKEVEGYYVWNKGYEHSLSKHFGTREFTCRCSHKECKEQRISISLVNKLEQIRVEVTKPLIVTSGFRCTRHQTDIRNSGQSTVVAKKSTHELGDAVDIVPNDRKDVREGFYKICAKHFDSIGLSDSFLHVDLRKGVRRWEY